MIPTIAKKGESGKCDSSAEKHEVGEIPFLFTDKWYVMDWMGEWFVMGSMGGMVCPGGIGLMVNRNGTCEIVMSSMGEVICHNFVIW